MLLLSTSVAVSAKGLTLADVAGTYKITTDLAPVVNVVTIEANGDVNFTEHSPVGSLECTGSAQLNNDLLTSEISCDNGLEFSHRVDFSNVEDFSSFSTMAFSSLYGVEVPVNVSKLD